MEGRLGIQYDRANHDILMSEYDRLTTFAEVNSWDARAQTEVERIVPVLRELDNRDRLAVTDTGRQETCAFAETIPQTPVQQSQA